MNELAKYKNVFVKLYSDHSIYFNKAAQFLIGYIAFYLINKNIGIWGLLATPIVTMALAIATTFLSPAFTALGAAALVCGHLFKLSLGVCGITFLIFLCMFIIYCQFTPDNAIYIMLTPLALLLKIPYVLAVVCGLAVGPVTAVPIALGVVGYQIILTIKDKSSVILGAEGILGQISTYVKVLFKDKSMWLMIITLVICVLVVYAVKTLPIPHCWKLATLAGVVTDMAVMLSGSSAFKVDVDFSSLFMGNVFALIAGLVAEFLLLSVKYSKTEKIQFEDDEYYYYVKAIPKLGVDHNKAKKTVKPVMEEEPVRRQRPKKTVRAEQGRKLKKKARPVKREVEFSMDSSNVSETDAILLEKQLSQELYLDDIDE